MRPLADEGVLAGVPEHAEPFVVESFIVLSTDILASAPSVIVRFKVSKNSDAVLQSFSILPQTPLAFYECIFDLAVDGRQVRNIRFIHLPENTERPPGFFRRYRENEEIQLRVFRRFTIFGKTGGIRGFPQIVFGRLAGKTWSSV